MKLRTACCKSLNISGVLKPCTRSFSIQRMNIKSFFVGQLNGKLRAACAESRTARLNAMWRHYHSVACSKQPSGCFFVNYAAKTIQVLLTCHSVSIESCDGLPQHMFWSLISKYHELHPSFFMMWKSASGFRETNVVIPKVSRKLQDGFVGFIFCAVCVLLSFAFCQISLTAVPYDAVSSRLRRLRRLLLTRIW